VAMLNLDDNKYATKTTTIMWKCWGNQVRGGGAGQKAAIATYLCPTRRAISSPHHDVKTLPARRFNP